MLSAPVWKRKQMRKNDTPKRPGKTPGRLRFCAYSIALSLMHRTFLASAMGSCQIWDHIPACKSRYPSTAPTAVVTACASTLRHSSPSRASNCSSRRP